MKNLFLVMLVSCGILFNAASANALEMFAPPLSYDSGSYTNAVTAGDFNGDGKLDLAVPNRYLYKVSIIINKGDNAFAPPVSYPISGDPMSVATADFDRDGHLDLAVTSHFSYILSVLINKGDGTFKASVGYAVDYYQYFVATGDFDKDGYSDLAVTHKNSTVSVLINNGDGTFGAVAEYGDAGVPMAVETGDFDGDDNLDLAVTNYSAHRVSVLINNGDGTFGAAVTYATGQYPRGVVPGDFNGDGNLDLATSDAHSDRVSVFINKGDGTFKEATTYATGLHPASVAAGDFNKDGYLDLVTANSLEDTVSVLINNGDGTFGEAADYATGVHPYVVITGDFNGDDKLDLAVANYSSNTVSILLNCVNNTQPGENVVVTDPETGTSMEFDSVISGGETTVTMTEAGGGGVPGPPEGFRIIPAGWYYEISTTAVFEGYVTIGIEYDDTGLTLRQEENLSLWHFSNGWRNITTAVDTEDNIIYGQTDHLSYFMVTSGITATADIDPNTLNLKSKGRYITCYIELPVGYDPNTINLDTLSISREGYWPVIVEPAPTEVGDRDNNGIADVMVKFSRPGVYGLFSSDGTGSIQVLVGGSLSTAGSPYFSAMPSVNVIDKGREHNNEANASSVEY